ncbi:hypothetical protein BDV93DRAFT_601147 [Ceratobasidium sp. AG-I]|nr:hypothetical protein BDV93DRAFT_601147 [Ceratobasidium sp. AG-I]
MPLFGNKSAAPASTAPPPPAETSPRRSRSMFNRRRSSASSISSVESERRRNSGGRKGFFGMGGSRASGDHTLDRDPSVIAAREKLVAAEKAERDADRALELARRAVLEARTHCKSLETQAAEEARMAKARRTEARSLGKRAGGLGRH